MKKILLTLAVLLFPGIASAQNLLQARGGVEVSQHNPAGRVTQFTIPGLQVISSTAAAARRAGHRGVIASLATAAATYTQYTATSSLGAMPYPARVDVRFFDSTTQANVLACTAAVVCGYNQFGVKLCETMSTINESENVTNNAFELVTSFSATGCTATGVSDTSDRLVASTSDQIGLRVPIAADSDVLAICYTSATTIPPHCVDGTHLTYGGSVLAGSAGAVATAIEPEWSVVDLDDIDTDTGADPLATNGGEDMIISVRVRGSSFPVTRQSR